MRKWWGFGGNLPVLLTVDLFLITTEFLHESRCFSTAVACQFFRNVPGVQLFFLGGGTHMGRLCS